MHAEVVLSDFYRFTCLIMCAQEAQAALSKREAEPSSLRAEKAALQKGLPQAARPQAGTAAAAPPIGFSAAAAVRYSQISPG